MIPYTQPVFKNRSTLTLGELDPSSTVATVGVVGFAITAIVLIGVPVGIYMLLKGKKKTRR